MKRQQLDKVIGKKISGGIGKGPRGKAAGQQAGQGKRADDARQPIAVRLIKGLGGK